MPEPRQRADPSDYLPLRPTDLQILLVLSNGPMHGYGLAKAVALESEGKVRLKLGSLYRLVTRLVASGLIEECELPETVSAAGEPPRRYYRITELALEVTRAETRRLAEVLRLARRRVPVDSTKGVG